MFVFLVPKHIVKKIFMTNYFVSKKAFIMFQKLKVRLKLKKKHKNCNILSPKTPENDLLTFN